MMLWMTLVGEIWYRKALYWKDPLLMLFVALRNKFILVVTYGKVPCFYFLEKALSLH